MLTWAVCHWGGYPERGWEREYIARLRNSLRRHCPVPHRFVAFMDEPSKAPPDVETARLRPASWRGNMPKFFVYNQMARLRGRVVLMDLDVVIVGDVSDFALYDGPLCTKAQWDPWVQRGEAVPDGDIIAFEAGGKVARKLDYAVRRNVHALARRHRSRERRVLSSIIPSCDVWQRVCPGQLISWKHDVRGGVLPDGARIVTFHGRPRQHEVPEAWIEEHWR